MSELVKHRPDALFETAVASPEQFAFDFAIYTSNLARSAYSRFAAMPELASCAIRFEPFPDTIPSTQKGPQDGHIPDETLISRAAAIIGDISHPHHLAALYSLQAGAINHSLMSQKEPSNSLLPRSVADKVMFNRQFIISDIEPCSLPFTEPSLGILLTGAVALKSASTTIENAVNREMLALQQLEESALPHAQSFDDLTAMDEETAMFQENQAIHITQLQDEIHTLGNGTTDALSLVWELIASTQALTDANRNAHTIAQRQREHQARIQNMSLHAQSRLINILQIQQIQTQFDGLTAAWCTNASRIVTSVFAWLRNPSDNQSYMAYRFAQSAMVKALQRFSMQSDQSIQHAAFGNNSHPQISG